MEILAALLTIGFACTRHRFWPTGVMWILGLAVLTTMATALIVQAYPDLVGPAGANLTGATWIILGIVEAALIAIVYGVTRAARRAFAKRDGGSDKLQDCE